MPTRDEVIIDGVRYLRRVSPDLEPCYYLSWYQSAKRNTEETSSWHSIRREYYPSLEHSYNRIKKLERILNEVETKVLK